MPRTLLTATTGATQSSGVSLTYNELPAQFWCPGIAGAEVGTLQYQDAGGSWHDFYDSSGSVATVTATNSGLCVYGPGIYRIDKDATAGATSVEISTARNP